MEGSSTASMPPKWADHLSIMKLYDAQELGDEGIFDEYVWFRAATPDNAEEDHREEEVLVEERGTRTEQEDRAREMRREQAAMFGATKQVHALALEAKLARRASELRVQRAEREKAAALDAVEFVSKQLVATQELLDQTSSERDTLREVCDELTKEHDEVRELLDHTISSRGHERERGEKNDDEKNDDDEKKDASRETDVEDVRREIEENLRGDIEALRAKLATAEIQNDALENAKRKAVADADGLRRDLAATEQLNDELSAEKATIVREKASLETRCLETEKALETALDEKLALEAKRNAATTPEATMMRRLKEAEADLAETRACLDRTRSEREEAMGSLVEVARREADEEDFRASMGARVRQLETELRAARRETEDAAVDAAGAKQEAARLLTRSKLDAQRLADLGANLRKIQAENETLRAEVEYEKSRESAPDSSSPGFPDSLAAVGPGEGQKKQQRGCAKTDDDDGSDLDTTALKAERDEARADAGKSRAIIARMAAELVAARAHRRANDSASPRGGGDDADLAALRDDIAKVKRERDILHAKLLRLKERTGSFGDSVVSSSDGAATSRPEHAKKRLETRDIAAEFFRREPAALVGDDNDDDEPPMSPERRQRFDRHYVVSKSRALDDDGERGDVVDGPPSPLRFLGGTRGNDRGWSSTTRYGWPPNRARAPLPPPATSPARSLRRTPVDAAGASEELPKWVRTIAPYYTKADFDAVRMRCIQFEAQLARANGQSDLTS